jgi:hypothetical protein
MLDIVREMDRKASRDPILDGQEQRKRLAAFLASKPRTLEASREAAHGIRS